MEKTELKLIIDKVNAILKEHNYGKVKILKFFVGDQHTVTIEGN